MPKCTKFDFGWGAYSGDAEIASPDITRPDNAAPDQTEVS